MAASLRTAALAVVVTAAAAAAHAQAPAQTPAQTPVAEIQFLYSPFTDYAPFFVAEEKGYFDEFGVDVTLAPKSGTAETIQLLASGNAEAGGSTWGAGLFNSINQGATVTIVATIAVMPTAGPSPSPFMVSEQAWNAGIQSVEALRGKRVGVPGPGGFGIYSVAKALETGGLTTADVELVNLPPPATAAAFANGSIEAGWSIEPFASQLEREQLGRRLVEDHTLGTELGFLAFNTEFVAANEDAVVRFIAGYLKAVRELESGGWQDPAILAIVAEYTGTPLELLTDLALTVRPADGAIDMDSVREQEEFFRAQGDLEYEGPIDIDQVYRRDLLDRANALLGG